jgi:diaminopropionate ammonia-lyase
VTTRIIRNPLRSPLDLEPPDPEVLAFHRRMPAYSATPMFDAPMIAARLNVGRVLVKAETQRLGLPSFKILGASWATYKALCDHIGHDPEPWANINSLAANLAHLRPFELAAATDGNHGRAVAFMARLLGFSAHIFVPQGTVEARIVAIKSEGARVTVVAGDYDAAVERSALEADDRCLVISDTSWAGYETTPRRVIEGYGTIFAEVDDALSASGLGSPDVVVIPVGVGAFMSAAVRHYRSHPDPSHPPAHHDPSQPDRSRTVVVSVEPSSANCVQASVEAGELAVVPGPHSSMMVGLNCGTPSMIAWPTVSRGVDWFVSVDDDVAAGAMRELAAAGVVAGETGAAALAGLSELCGSGLAQQDLNPDSTVLIVVTEGATDRDNYEAIVGRSAESIGRILVNAS